MKVGMSEIRLLEGSSFVCVLFLPERANDKFTVVGGLSVISS